MTNINLSREIFDCFFCDEDGNQLDGPPELLCVDMETVIEQFPETKKWPIVGEHSEDRCSYVIGNGIYLFPDFNFENPAFEAI